MNISIVVDDKYQAAHDRALVDHGPNVLVDLVTTWLKDREHVQDDTDITAAKDGKADAATKARLRVKLGL